LDAGFFLLRALDPLALARIHFSLVRQPLQIDTARDALLRSARFARQQREVKTASHPTARGGERVYSRRRQQNRDRQSAAEKFSAGEAWRGRGCLQSRAAFDHPRPGAQSGGLQNRAAPGRPHQPEINQVDLDQVIDPTFVRALERAGYLGELRRRVK